MTKKQNFNIQLHTVVIGANLENRKQYVLSLDSKDIVIPSMFLDHITKIDINKTITDFINNYIVADPLVLLPQLIKLHDSSLSKSKNTISPVYGSIVTYRNDLKQGHWVEFNFVDPTKYSQVIFETIQNLK
jgi:hypothetical protein